MTENGSMNPAVDVNRDNKRRFIIQPFMFDNFNAILRCASGLGPSGRDGNTVLGGWYFKGSQIHFGTSCSGSVIEVRGANPRIYPGVINLYLCGTFTTTEEGIYECRMMNSSMIEQTERVGVYFSGRSESLNMYPITLVSSLYTAAPMIDTPDAVTVTVTVPFRLFCISQGSPPDAFTWRKGNGPTKPSTSVTAVTYNSERAVFRAEYIDTIVTSSTITYTCTVINPIGSDSETITVTASECICENDVPIALFMYNKHIS